jgi:uncharacterized protein YpbB
MFLYMVNNLNGNRTVFGAYHILKGKKTSQTLQDCRLFQLTNLFGVYKQLERATVVDVVNDLVKKNYIRACGENRFVLTQEGETLLKRKLTENPLPVHLNGFAYRDTTGVFWTRLALLTQCLSNLKANIHEFFPVIRDARTQLWIKNKLSSNQIHTSELATKLYFEMETMLHQFSNLEATVFVLRLSGTKRVGLTIDQVADELNIDRIYARLLFINILHGMMKKAMENKYNYPTIFSMIDEADSTILLTETAKKTYTLLQRGLDIKEISSMRSLKENTVEDHIVEVALNCHDYRIERFVSLEQQRAIMAVVSELNTRRLKEIKDRLHHTISYFQIRLTLAKKGF